VPGGQQREGRAIRRRHAQLTEARYAVDLAVAGDGPGPAGEDPGDQREHLERRGALEHRGREPAVYRVGALADEQRAAAEVAVGVRVLDDHRDALDGGLARLEAHPRGVYEVAPVERADRGPREVPLAEPGLAVGMGIDPLDHARIEANPGGERETALVRAGQVDPDGPEAVRHAE